MAFYDFPTEHWKHLRTANPIEVVRAGAEFVNGKLVKAV